MNVDLPDLKGRVVRIYDAYTALEKNCPVTDYLNSSTLPEARFELKKVLRIEKDLNCKLEFVGGERIEEKIWAFVTTIDLFYGPEYKFVNYYYHDNKPFVHLDEYEDILELNNDDLWNVKKQETFAKAFGATRFVCIKDDLNSFDYNTVMYFNKSMMINENLWDEFNLFDMQQYKTWTWENFAELCMRVTGDTDEDGIVDQFGFRYSWHIFDDFIMSNSPDPEGATLLRLDEENNLVISVDEPHKKATLDFLRGLYANRCLLSIYRGPDFHMDLEISPIEIFTEGRVLFYPAYGGDLKSINKFMQDKWGAVAFPSGPDNPGCINYVSDYGDSIAAILKGAEGYGELAYVLRYYAPSAIPTEELTDEICDQFDEFGFDPTVSQTYKLLSPPNAVCVDTVTFNTIWDQTSFAISPSVSRYMWGSDDFEELKQDVNADFQGRLDKEWESLIGILSKEIRKNEEQNNNDG
ncbi:MAG TPA: hypothetical protein PLZ84_04450 [Clostridia bacterium]|nr:hypothetical protein [Clostridia bacterium]